MDNTLVRDAPSVEPLHVAVVLVGSCHTPADWHKEDVQANDDRVQKSVADILNGLVLVAHSPVNEETETENGKVERWVVVVYVSDTSHDNKWQIVEEPSENRVQASVVDLINVGLRELPEASLPSENIPDSNKTHSTQRQGRSPVGEGVAKEEVLDNLVIPATHAQTNVQNGPLPPLRSKIILLVGIGHKSVVRGHHGNVQVDKVVEEGRLILAGVSRGH
jgi:hypothetical protein